jgi:ABC-2 type transport system ATP-binding protein
MQSDTCLIHLEHVSKTFGREQAVRDVSLDVYCGQILGVIGPSGCGKTTTIRLLLGVYFPTEGEVTVHGRVPSQFTREVHEDIGYMPQFFVLYPYLTIDQTLDFMASVYGLGLQQRRTRIDEVLDLVGLSDARKQRAGNISGGMRRRLQLACALLHEPSVLVFDEPTAGIDPILRARFWDHFRSLRDEGRTLVITTQYVTEAEYCDQVALMDEGRVVALGSPAELRQRAFRGVVIDVVSTGHTPECLAAVRKLEGVSRVESVSLIKLRIYVDSAASRLPRVLDVFEKYEIAVSSTEDYYPSFDEVFVRLIESRGF